MKKQKSSRNSKCLGACPNEKDKNDYVKGQNKIIMPHQSNQKGQIEETWWKKKRLKDIMTVIPSF